MGVSRRDVELALWLQGAAAMIGDREPTPFEWQAIRDKANSVIADAARERLFESDKVDKEMEYWKQKLAIQQAMMGMGPHPYGGTE